MPYEVSLDEMIEQGFDLEDPMQEAQLEIVLLRNSR